MTPIELVERAQKEYEQTSSMFSESRAIYWMLRAIYSKLDEIHVDIQSEVNRE